MGALNYLAYTIFAVLFISIGVAMYAEYQRGSAEQEFRLKAEELAEQIQELRGQSPGSIWYFDISVPSNCELGFADNAILISIGEWSENIQVGVRVNGENFTSQDLCLKLTRTEDGVDITVV